MLKNNFSEKFELPHRDDIGPKLMRFVSRGRVDRFLQNRAEWMIEKAQMVKYLRPRIRYVDKMAGIIENGQTIVSIGSGKGHELEEMDIMLPGSKIIGIDPHDYFTSPVKKRTGLMAEKLTYLTKDYSALNLDNLDVESADAFTLFFVLHHIPEESHTEIFKKIKAKLKDDGYVFIAEDLVSGEEERKKVEKTDRILNAELRSAPHNYRDFDKWRDFFAEQGFQIVDFHEDVSGPVRHGFFVLQKTK